MRSVNHSHRLTQRRAVTLVLAICVPLVVGCGNTLYAVQATSASGKLEEARELGAELYAPYEYFYAKEHLQKAQTEAAEADYSDAIDLAEVSQEYASRAIRLTREARRGAGASGAGASGAGASGAGASGAGASGAGAGGAGAGGAGK